MRRTSSVWDEPAATGEPGERRRRARGARTASGSAVATLVRRAPCHAGTGSGSCEHGRQVQPRAKEGENEEDVHGGAQRQGGQGGRGARRAAGAPWRAGRARAGRAAPAASRRRAPAPRAPPASWLSAAHGVHGSAPPVGRRWRRSGTRAVWRRAAGRGGGAARRRTAQLTRALGCARGRRLAAVMGSSSSPESWSWSQERARWRRLCAAWLRCAGAVRGWRRRGARGVLAGPRAWRGAAAGGL